MKEREREKQYTLCGQLTEKKRGTREEEEKKISKRKEESESCQGVKLDKERSLYRQLRRRGEEEKKKRRRLKERRI